MGGFEPPPPCSQSRWAPVTLHPENLERLAGIEPVVESLEDSYSAIELQPRILERSAGIEPAPRHWQCRILPLNHDRPNLVDAGEVESPLPVCRTGVLPLSLRAQTWCPVRLGIPGPLVCRTSAHNPSELTGQILVGAEELESSTRRVRAGYVATNTSLPPGADAANRTRVSSVPGTRSATELRRLEALIGFEPTTCSFGRSRAGPLRYRAEISPYNFGVTDGSRTR